jgi:PIN domain nuclease of toxin-antitoxin system
VILLDTHTLLWLSQDDPQLGKAARETIAQASLNSEILVSAASFWEIGLLLDKARIILSAPLSEWADAVMGRDDIRVIPITADIAVEASSLPGTLHGDPGDRFLIATARIMRARLLTSDGKILAYAKAGHVEATAAHR